MAIIICPECGGKVSTTRKICIHCGKEIKATKKCPECEEIIVAEAKECPICGYFFEEMDDNSKIVTNESTNETIIENKDNKELIVLKEENNDCLDKMEEVNTNSPNNEAVVIEEVNTNTPNNEVVVMEEINEISNISEEDESEKLACPYCGSLEHMELGTSFYMCFTCKGKFVDINSNSISHSPVIENKTVASVPLTKIKDEDDVLEENISPVINLESDDNLVKNTETIDNLENIDESKKESPFKNLFNKVIELKNKLLAKINKKKEKKTDDIVVAETTIEEATIPEPSLLETTIVEQDSSMDDNKEKDLEQVSNKSSHDKKDKKSKKNNFKLLIIILLSILLLGAILGILIGVVFKHRHDFDHEIRVISPTCTTEGYTEFVCECGAISVDFVKPALGHVYSEGTVILEPTCTTPGIQKMVCIRCSKSYDKTLPAKGHQNLLTNQVKATCTTDGYNEYTCSICNNVETFVTELASGQHNYESSLNFVDHTIIFTCGCGDSYTKSLFGYTFYWKNYNGDLLYFEQYEHKTPYYKGDKPVKKTDEKLFYIFTGWEITEITSSTITYVAQYSTQEYIELTLENYSDYLEVGYRYGYSTIGNYVNEIIVAVVIRSKDDSYSFYNVEFNKYVIRWDYKYNFTVDVSLDGTGESQEVFFDGLYEEYIYPTESQFRDFFESIFYEGYITGQVRKK